jgi:hypothetical protein
MAKKSGGSPKQTGKTSSNPARPTLEQLQEEIRAKAHEIYLQRISSGEPGDDLSDWLRAEAEIKRKYNL